MRKFSLNVVNISKKYSRKKPLVPEKMRGGGLHDSSGIELFLPFQKTLRGGEAKRVLDKFQNKVGCFLDSTNENEFAFKPHLDKGCFKKKTRFILELV